MGTVTAQILIGSPHPNDGGIIPSHYLFLSENDRPSWSLVGANIFQENEKEFSKIVWIPTLDNMVEWFISSTSPFNWEVAKSAKK